MPFEDLIKLKQKLGTKVYNSTVLGVVEKQKKSVSSDSRTTYKRDNKNRPREMSSKRPIPLIPARPKKKAATETTARDPRFDPKCGDFDRDEFKERFSFVNEIKLKEVSQLKDEMLKCKDSDERSQMRLLAQRLENQAREEQNRREADRDRKRIQDSRTGGQPVIFESKKKRKIENLVQKFRELKESGKLQKHIEKRRKKQAAKDRKKLKVLD